MRPPLPLPTAPRTPLANKPARKAASGAPANRPARKATPTHDSTSTHKASRRKGASNDGHDRNNSATDAKGAAVDFAAMLAQNAAQPAAAATATTPTANDKAKGDEALGTDATALLRPPGLAPTVDASADEAAAEGNATALDGADAGTAPGETPASELETADAAAALDPNAAAGQAGGPISMPSELASASNTLTMNASDGAHRRDGHENAPADQLPSVTAAGQDTTDVASVVGSSATEASHTSSEQSAGDGAASSQQQPDLANSAAAVGLTPSTTGKADAVSDAPIPAHTVAPTIAQVAQSLRTSGDGTSRLVIRLDPVELGPVLVSLRTRNGMVDINVRADNAGGAAAVADQRAHIQQVLAEHGLDLSSFSVSGGEASGGAGSSTADSGMSDASGDGSPNGGNAGADANASSYADVQAQASGADGQTGDRRAFAGPQEGVGAFRTTVSTSSSDGATGDSTTRVRTVRREGTWL